MHYRDKVYDYRSVTLWQIVFSKNNRLEGLQEWITSIIQKASEQRGLIIITYFPVWNIITNSISNAIKNSLKLLLDYLLN